MQLAGWLTVFVFITLLAGGGSAAILIFCNPFEISFWILFLFYLFLFINLAGLFTLIGFLIRRLIRGSKRVSQKQVIYHLRISFRQAILLSFLLIILLLLQSQGLRTWWNLLGLVAVIGLIEWYWAGRVK